jgi:two-component system, cell cycle response regulator DivK
MFPMPVVYLDDDEARRKAKGRPAPRPKEGRGPDLQDMTVLLVDDIEDTRTLYQRYFQWMGVRMVTAPDGIDALRSVARLKPDVIVLDLAMPKMTGWEVLKSLKANPATQRIPVLVLSGQQERQSAILAGADSYCEKPCLPDALLSEVRKVLQKSMRKA